MKTYEQLDTFLKGKDTRTISSIRATIVRRGDWDRTSIIVSYHGTSVVRALPDGTFYLNTGGYRTATTKSRIRTFSPARVYQKASVWYLTWANAAGEWHTKECTVRFYDGIRVDANGVLVQL